MKAINTRIIVFTALVLPIVLALLLVKNNPTSAGHGSVIDFEGLARGTIVHSVSSGAGISGEVVSGSVSVFGLNPKFGPGINAAMIFDATCSPGGTPADCTGGDADLFAPELGNILIISENLNSDDPNDADVKGAFYKFDYSGWGSGKVTVEDILIFDVEDDEGSARVELFSGGEGGILLATVGLPITGDNKYQIVPIGIAGVDFMRVTLNGSGAIDNVRIKSEEEATPTFTPPVVTATNTPTATEVPTDVPTPALTPFVPQPSPTDTPPVSPTETPSGQTTPPSPASASPTPASPPVLLPVTGEGPPNTKGGTVGSITLLLIGVAVGFAIGIGFHKWRSAWKKGLGITLFALIVIASLLAAKELTSPAIAGQPQSVWEIYSNVNQADLADSAGQTPNSQGSGVNQVDTLVQTSFSPSHKPSRLATFPRTSAVESSLEIKGEVSRVVIPSLNVDAPIRSIPYDGETWDMNGLGEDIAYLDGIPGLSTNLNTVLAGHTTLRYSANGPFRNLHKLTPGDNILIFTGDHVLTFTAREQRIVDADEVSILYDTKNPQLTLLTCAWWDENTLSYVKRLVVFADLTIVSTAYRWEAN